MGESESEFRSRTLPLWTRTRTQISPIWTRTQALWTRTLVFRTRTPPGGLGLTVSPGESGEKYKANLNFHVQKWTK